MLYLLIFNIAALAVLFMLCLAHNLKTARENRIFRLYIEDMDVGYCKFYFDTGIIIEANDVFAGILDTYLSGADIQGRDIDEMMIWEEQREKVKKHLENRKHVRKMQVTVKALSGKSVHLIMSARMRSQITGHGNIVEMIIQDVTGLKTAYERMRATQKRYEKLFKDSGDMVCTCEIEDMTVDEVNPVAGVITGYSPDELVGKPLTDIVHPFRRKDFYDIREDIHFRDSSEKESVLVTKRGEYKQIMLTASRVSLDDKDVIMLVIKDISSLVRDRDEKQRRFGELEEFRQASIEREERIRDLKRDIEELKSENTKLKENK
jgi:PAS domain S-box-containing protein